MGGEQGVERPFLGAAQYPDSDQEEEEDPGAIPSYKFAPDQGLLTAEEEVRATQSPSNLSPKKVPEKGISNKIRDSSGGMRLSSIHHGLTTESADPYAAHGLAPASGGDLGELGGGLGGLTGLGLASGLAGGLGGLGGLGSLGTGLGTSLGGGGLGGAGLGSGLGAGLGSGLGSGLGGGLTTGLGFDGERAQGLGSLGSGLGTGGLGGIIGSTGPDTLSSTEGMDTLGTAPGAGYGLSEPFGASQGLGLGGNGLLSGFNSIGLNRMSGSLLSSSPSGPPAVDHVGGLGQYGGYGVGDVPAPPTAPPSLGPQVSLSTEHLSTAPPSAQPASEMGSAYLSESAPPSSMFMNHIPTQAPAYIMRGGGGYGGGGPEAASREAGVGGRTDAAGAAWGREAERRHSRDLATGLPGYMGGLGGVVGNDFAGKGGYMEGDYGLGLGGPWAQQPPPPPPAHMAWLDPSSQKAMRDLDNGHVDYVEDARSRGRAGARGQAKAPRNERNDDPSGSGAAGEREAKGRLPLSGGGPKRTDYLKKYGGGGAAPEANEGGQGGGGGGGGNNSNVPITTVMLKNIPCRKGQEEVMTHIDQKGFGNRYDFFYLPRDVKFRANLGYAFINFLTPEDAENFTKEMNGYRFSSSGSTKACQVVPAHVQGLVNNLAAFRRTEVMRSSRRPYFSTSTSA